MIRLLVFFFSSIYLHSTLLAQVCNYHIDFKKEKNDMLYVELNLEGISSSELEYKFPKIVPGTYAIEDYGKYIKEFKAFDKSGKELKVRKKGRNIFRIKDAQEIVKISYWVNDTWDSKFRKNKIFKPAGTSFESGNCYYLNSGALFGYFDDLKDQTIKVEFENRNDLLGTSAMKTSTFIDRQIFTADSYFELVDSPILFAKPDTFSFQINNCIVNVSAYHSGGKKVAEELKPQFKNSMKAIDGFFDTLPSNSYSFLIYIDDASVNFKAVQENPKFAKILGLDRLYPSTGALEHGKSSTYYLLDIGDISQHSILSQIDYRNSLKAISIHEFMHILTPLNLRSQFIDEFDFQSPKMSKHLWMYEGITEYFAGIIPVKARQTDPRVYLNKTLKEKVDYGAKFPYKKMSMLEMSAKVLKRKYHKQYDQVYHHGAVLALCLDLEIIKLTNGAKDLREILLELLEEYNIDNSMDEELLISEIVKRVHPDLQSFFDSYVAGNEELLINHYLHYAGVRYFLYDQVYESAPIISRLYGITKISGSYWKSLIKGEVEILETIPGGPFKSGDIINYFEFMDQVKDENGFDKVKEGDIISLNVKNMGDVRNVELEIKFTNDMKINHYRIDEEVSDDILNIRNKWWTF